MRVFKKLTLIILTCLATVFCAIMLAGCGEEPHVHDYSYFYEERPADCMNGGYVKKGCSCGDMIIESETPPTEHEYVVFYVQPPTAEMGGYTIYKCETCCDEYIGDETDPVQITVWLINEYDGATNTQKVNYGDKLTKPSDPSKPGYEFAFWADEQGYAWDFENNLVFEQMTLTAKYTAIEYTISYDLAGGREDYNPSTFTIEHEFSLSAPQKRGYDFIGWTGTDLSEPTLEVEFKNSYGNKEYTANWQAKTISVTFDTVYNGFLTPKQVTFDQTYGTLPDVDREHYSLKGWYTSLEGGTKILDTTLVNVTNGITLYAQFEPISYNIKYNGVDSFNVGNNPKVYDVEDTITLINPTKYGYDFMGWTGTDLTEPSFEVVIDKQGGNREYTALWQAKTFTVNFDSKGGSEVNSQQVSYDGLYGELPVTEKFGYVFDGWVNHINEKITEDDTFILTTDTTLYATWISLVNYELNDDEQSYTANGFNLSQTELVVLDTHEGLPVTSVGGFKDDEEITKVKLGANVKTILASAFQNCTALKNIEWNDNLESIYLYAFSGCALLEQIDVPSSVQEVGIHSFMNCTSLHTVNIGDGITTIAYSTFNGCTSLENVTFGEKVEVISGGSFSGCSALQTITLAGNIHTIAHQAFQNCTELQTVTLGEKAINFGSNSFSGCASLTKVDYLGDISQWAQMSQESASYSPLRIAKRLFINGEEAKNVTISSIDKIGEGAFYGCTSLETVVIKGVATIGDASFAFCPNLTTVTMDSVATTIKNGAFNGCDLLKTVTLTSSVQTIEVYAFANCPNLTKINYNSTKYYWNEIDKATYWDANSTKLTISCVDGTID